MDCFKIEKGSSLVRIFHASPDAPAVDIYIDDKLEFSNFNFKEFTKYVSLKEGDYQIDIYPSGTKEIPVISEVIELEDENIFTVAATGNLKDLSLLMIPDYVSKKTSDKYSSFRVIHLSPDTPSIDVLVNQDLLFKDIEFREGTDYVDVNPNKYNVEIVLHDSEYAVLSMSIELKSNRIYTIYAVGNAKDISAIQSVDGNTYVC